MVTGLQSRGKLLQGLREVIALRLGHPFARFIVAVAQFLFLLQPTAKWLFLVPPTLAISLALSVPGGRSLWADRLWSTTASPRPTGRLCCGSPCWVQRR